MIDHPLSVSLTIKDEARRVISDSRVRKNDPAKCKCTKQITVKIQKWSLKVLLKKLIKTNYKNWLLDYNQAVFDN